MMENLVIVSFPAKPEMLETLKDAIKNGSKIIISNLNLINEKSQELKDLIDEVQFNLDEYSRITDRKIDRTNNDLVDLQDSFDGQNRQNRRKFADIEQTLTQLQNEINELRKRSPETINQIAISTSSDLLKQLIGADVNQSNISAIVEDLSKKEKGKYYGV